MSLNSHNHPDIDIVYASTSTHVTDSLWRVNCRDYPRTDRDASASSNNSNSSDSVINLSSHNKQAKREGSLELEDPFFTFYNLPPLQQPQRHICRGSIELGDPYFKITEPGRIQRASSLELGDPYFIAPRASSLELEDPFFTRSFAPCTTLSSYSRQSAGMTGRPKRKSAGKKAIDPVYVNPEDVIDDDDDSDNGQFANEPELDSEDSSSDEDDMPPRKKAKKDLRKSLKTRAPSTSPPPLSPMQSDVEDADSDVESTINTPTDENSFSLVVKIPEGFKGDFVVRIDKNALTSAFHNHGQSAQSPISATRESPPPPVSHSTEGKQGFLDFPPEIRNKIYSLLFVKSEDLMFWEPRNFSSSAAFLATCKQICHEGASVLYGANLFCFDRNRNSRSQYWDKTRKEIGYKDMRRFLSRIGSTNLGFIRRLYVAFEDANPSSAPYTASNESRRFLNDGQLLECLRIIGRGAKLQYFEISFLGRRKVNLRDDHFLDVLSRIKTDELKITPHRKWPYHYHFCKVEDSVRVHLDQKMVRREKRYPHTASPEKKKSPIKRARKEYFL